MEKEVSFGQVSSSENSKLNENKAAEKKDDSSKAGASKAESSQTENTSKPDSSSKETDNAGDSSTSGGSAGVESGSAASGSGRGGDGGSAHTPQSSASSHSHVWKDHIATKQVWVPNMVTVDDYETQTISGAQFYTFSGYNELGQPTYTSDGPTYWFENGFTMDDLKEIIVEGLGTQMKQAAIMAFIMATTLTAQKQRISKLALIRRIMAATRQRLMWIISIVTAAPEGNGRLYIASKL
ncbi:hypothetical protein DWY99_02900 [[Clostridium] leptum]|uniref:Uncharacterized protein n=1 Tax=[Clostridium] leptum TaxID=1535 RepID=A0A412B061_9FIRM|nr:hypothetical protein DWY99_02900 [[Clostridium] leptum]